MDESSSSLTHGGPPLAVHLKVGTEGEKQRFLKALQPSFLENVDPWSSGLLDHMMCKGVLTVGDKESLDGRDVHTERDLRRKVWFYLTRLTVKDLQTEVFPKLYKDFSHIIPETFLTQKAVDSPTAAEEEEEEEADGKGCFLQKVLPKVRTGVLVDKMFQYDIIDLDRYRQLFKDGCAKTVIEEKLLLECHASQSHYLLPMLKDVLEMHRIPVPANLAELVPAGVPCTCCQRSAPSLHSTPPSHKKVNSWLRKLPLMQNVSRSGSTRSTESTGLCSISSSGAFPCLPKSAAEASNSLVSDSSTNEACPLPEGYRGMGETGARSGNACKESPHISVIDGYPSPPARPEAFSSDFVLQTPASTPAAAAAAPQRVEMGRGQGEVSSQNGRIHLEGSTEVLIGGQSQCQPFFCVPMLLFSEIRKFMVRHCLTIILFLVSILVLVLAMNGFNIFQLTRGSYKSNEQLLTEIKQDKRLIKNVTSIFEQYPKQREKRLIKNITSLFELYSKQREKRLIKNITSIFEQYSKQQEKRLMTNITSIFEQYLKPSGYSGAGDLVKSSES